MFPILSHVGKVLAFGGTGDSGRHRAVRRPRGAEVHQLARGAGLPQVGRALRHVPGAAGAAAGRRGHPGRGLHRRDRAAPGGRAARGGLQRNRAHAGPGPPARALRQDRRHPLRRRPGGRRRRAARHRPAARRRPRALPRHAARRRRSRLFRQARRRGRLSHVPARAPPGLRGLPRGPGAARGHARHAGRRGPRGRADRRRHR